jgi:hypothetical protein
MLIPSINKNLDELVDLLRQLSKSEYADSCAELSGASIGEHTRHIIEMFQCLERQYDMGVINYDNRDRNGLIQTDKEFATDQILDLKGKLDKENKNIELKQIIDQEEIRIKSNYFRELLYNLEHCIHHQALIKVAVLKLENVIVDADFGVARSTIEYRNKCVQ